MPEQPAKRLSPEAARERSAHAAHVAQMLNDSEAEVVSGYNHSVLTRFLRVVWPYRKRISISFIAVLGYSLSAVAIPLLVGLTIDRVVSPGGSTSVLGAMVGAMAGLAAVNWVSNYFQQTIIGGVSQQVLYDLRGMMFRHLQRVGLSFTERVEVGRVMSRLQGDVGALQELLEVGVLSLGDMVTLAGITIVLLVLDWRLGMLTLIIVPALVLVRMFWLPRARQSFINARRAVATAHGALNENLSGVRVVQGMTREQMNYRLYEQKVQDSLDAYTTAARYGASLLPAVDTLTGLAMAIVVVVGGNYVLGGSLQIGVMIAFMLYVQRFFEPIRHLTMHYSVMQRAMASGERIYELLDVAPDVVDKPDGIELENIDGSIEFRNVTFGYELDTPVLKDVSFTVAPGETVALVGPTGSGKTSITALVHRFYDVWDGQILVGGHDVRDVTQESLGRQVSMVLQEPFLFTGTVFENIRYRRLDATRETVEEAAKAVGAHDFIMQLSDGYDTVLGERGGGLSVGQRQLLSFARALVADAKILVLDEATASIDSYTEKLIQKALETLLEGRTGLIIAHRLATVRNADRTIVLQNGMIAEEGTHEQLVEMGGLYAGLYALNYASFDEIPDEVLKSMSADATT